MLNTTNLSEGSTIVLKQAIDSMRGNGFDFGFTDDIVVAGWPAGKVGGHLTDLTNRGVIQIFTDRGDQLIEPAGDQYTDERYEAIAELVAWSAEERKR